MLPSVEQNSGAAATQSSRSDAIKAVIWLSWFTIIYNVVEGVVSIFFGVEEVSVSLFGFGVDSFIEVFSAFIVLWRFKKEELHLPGLSLAREKTASSLIGGLFVLLAISTAIFSALHLVEKKHPDTTLPGAIISILSLSFMFFLWSRKRKLGQELQSSTVLSDAACSLACIKLSVILLLGSGLFFFLPSLWWADSVAALLMSYFIYKEGREIRKSAQDGNGHSCCGCG